jgi:lipopolysaccharide export system permease protein
LRILSRYIFKEAALFFAITLFAFTGILLTLRMLHFASLIVNRGVEASQIAEVFVSIVPTFLEIAIPMSTLLGVMMAFARLSGDSEIIVMRASGISLYELVVPVVFFGLVTAAVGLYVSLELKPWGFRNLSRVLFEIARSKSTSGLTEGVFNPLGNLTLYAETIEDGTGSLARILIDDRRDKKNRRIIVAKSGKIVSDERSQTITLQLFNGESHEIVDKRYVTTHFFDNNIVMQTDDLFEGTTREKDKSPREMSVRELRHNIAVVTGKMESIRAEQPSDGDAGSDASPAPVPGFREVRKRFHRLRAEFGSRFAMPFASFVLALIALPLGIVPPRTQKTWGAGLSLTVGLAVFVVYYGALSVGLSLSESGRVNTYAALWLPNIACALVAAFFIRRMASERWFSVADAASSLLARLGSAVVRVSRRR